MTNAWPWWERSKATSLSVKAGWILASEVSLKLKVFLVRLINTTSYFLCVKKIEIEPAIIWSSNLSADNFKNSNSVGRYVSPRYGQVMMVSGCCSLRAVNWLNFIRMANFRIKGLLTASVSKTFQSGRSCFWALVVSDLIVVLSSPILTAVNWP